jgi:tripartite-type tricarboxylate transporter receptor subunit TctC
MNRLSGTPWFSRVAIVLMVAAMPFCADAQSGGYPTKPVRIVVASGAGSGDDFVVRTIAPNLGELLGQQIVIDNRPGAGGLIGQNLVLKAAPDGYTLLLAGGSMAGAKFVNAQATYDVLRDFTPISMAETSQFAMITHLSVPAKNLREYIALARGQPGKMTFATIGAGQIPYWSAHLFNNMAGIKAVEVTYKAIGDATVDVMSGRVDYFFAPLATAVAQKARVRVVAVTGAERSPVLPDVPTMSEAALGGFEMPAWRSIMGPAGMRRDVVGTLNTALVQILATPNVRQRFATAGSEPISSSPEDVTKRYADWIGRFGKIAAQAGIKPI